MPTRYAISVLATTSSCRIHWSLDCLLQILDSDSIVISRSIDLYFRFLLLLLFVHLLGWIVTPSRDEWPDSVRWYWFHSRKQIQVIDTDLFLSFCRLRFSWYIITAFICNNYFVWIRFFFNIWLRLQVNCCVWHRHMLILRYQCAQLHHINWVGWWYWIQWWSEPDTSD